MTFARPQYELTANHVTEEWRTVRRDYEVSNWGRVRRVAPRRGAIPGYVIGQTIDEGGYRRVQLYVDSKCQMARVHVLICEAFHGPRPPGMQLVRHLDGNSLNDAPENLVWGTYSENGLDAVRHGSNWAANATHCPHGHEYSPENLLPGALRKGIRACRSCNVVWQSNYRARKRAARAGEISLPGEPAPHWIEVLPETEPIHEPAPEPVREPAREPEEVPA